MVQWEGISMEFKSSLLDADQVGRLPRLDVVMLCTVRRGPGISV